MANTDEYANAIAAVYSGSFTSTQYELCLKMSKIASPQGRQAVEALKHCKKN